MKRAKFILATIAVFAVVGGVYASKAHRSTNKIFIKTTTLPAAICSIRVNALTLTPNPVFETSYYATTTSTTTCGYVPVYLGE